MATMKMFSVYKEINSLFILNKNNPLYFKLLSSFICKINSLQCLFDFQSLMTKIKLDSLLLVW